MGVYIKNWSLADWKELLKWAKIGANNAMIGEFSEVEEVPPHGRLIDADALLKRIAMAKTDQPEIADVYDEEAEEVEAWLSYAPTIIPASGGTDNE